jgi:sigma-B regulation protein RsbU (phosphoserine phosphatase)
MSDNEHLNKLEQEVRNLHEQNSSLLGMFDMTTGYLEKTKKNLEISEKKLLKVNKHLIDSINYAKYIQDAFVVKAENLKKIIPNSFVFQQPKDIVSGDFVWLYEDKIKMCVGVGDCTGHGVPGAMLSIFVVSMLNQIVNQHGQFSPAQILLRLDKLMGYYLTKYDNKIRDSVEISLIEYHFESKKITFSAAKRPLALVRNGQLTIYEGSKVVLGDTDRSIGSIANQSIDIEKGDVCYLFSDGFADQFGEETNSRFTTKKMLQLLEKVAILPAENQEAEIQQVFKAWKGTKTQTDDVLVLGLCF